MRTRPVLPPVYLLVAALAMIALHMALPVAHIGGISWRLFLGGAIIIAGGTVIASCARSFWKVGTPIRPFEESSTLVITGLFRYSRNPMYIGMGGILFGLALVLGTATPFAVPPVFVVVITRRFVLHEEEALESHFGGRYTDYKSRVRRWL